MALRKLNARVKIRRKKASEFTNENPVLLAGELAVEQDTNKVKVGDGTTPWNKLKYLVDMDSIKQLIEDYKQQSNYAVIFPIGSIVYYPKNSIPSFYSNNWKICNGANVAKSVYPDLFNYMGWSGSTHALPNLIDNRFIEGSTSTCQYKNAGLPNIKGGFAADNSTFNRENGNIIPFGCFLPTGDNRYFTFDIISGTDYGRSSTILFDASRSGVRESNGTTTQWNTIYSDSVNTVQPKSITLLPIIRVK